MKAIGYTRVSTSDQVDNGVSLDAQEQKIRQYAALYGFDLVEVVVDAGVSAKTLNRLGVRRVLDAMRTGSVDAVIVAKLDRLTRSVRDLAELVELSNERGVALVSVAEKLDTGSAAGRMVVNIMGCVSQWEREAISERTSAALRHKRASGQVFNRFAPYGFRRSGDELVVDDSEMTAIRLVEDMRAAGFRVATIARELGLRGFKTRSGSAKWHAQTVKNIVDATEARNALVAGIEKSTHGRDLKTAAA